MDKLPASLFVGLRVFAGLVFMATGVMKLVNPYENFLVEVLKFRVVSGFPAQAVAFGVPWLELLLGAYLLAGLWTRRVLFGLWAMNTAFILLILQALIRKLPIEACGCFGEALALSLNQTLLLDCVLWGTFFLLYRAWEKTTRMSLDRRLETKN